MSSVKDFVKHRKKKITESILYKGDACARRPRVLHVDSYFGKLCYKETRIVQSEDDVTIESLYYKCHRKDHSRNTNTGPHRKDKGRNTNTSFTRKTITSCDARIHKITL